MVTARSHKKRLADVVIFGGNGDLALRKLLPALYQLERTGRFDAHTRIVGASRRELGQDGYRDMVRAALIRFVPEAELEDQVVSQFIDRIDYAAVDATRRDSFAALGALLADAPERDRVFYFSTSPSLFAALADNLAAEGLVTPTSRVVLEKPLGHDLQTSRAINADVAKVFAEDQIFRIDHYLGKETVQNLLVLRFANGLFEPLWNNAHIDHVQITVAEQVGVEGRWGYYDTSGALRDMVQNHLLQLLCLVAMEPPSHLIENAVRDEKVKVLRALRPIDRSTADSDTVRGRYRAGAVAGQAVPGYLDEDGANPDSVTESFVALRCHIDNWRWAGVPFYLRTGKRLTERVSEIVIQFKSTPHWIFPQEAGAAHANRLVLRLQPDDGVQLLLNNKQPGAGEVRLSTTALNVTFAEAFGARSPGAYERLLLDVIDNNSTLFVRRDEIELAWTWIDGIRAAWQAQGDKPKAYTAGGWGPTASIALIERDGRTWHEEME